MKQLHLILDRLFPPIKGLHYAEIQQEDTEHLESLTLDVYFQLGQVLSLWNSAAHDSPAHNQSSEASISVKCRACAVKTPNKLSVSLV